MKGDLELIFVSTLLPLPTIILAARLAEYLGTPGLGSAEEGLSRALGIVLMRAIAFTLIVYAILKGYEKLVAVGLLIILSSLTFLVLRALFALFLPWPLDLLASLLLTLTAFTDVRRIFKLSLAISIGALLSVSYPFYAVRLFAVILSIADIIATLKGPMAVVAYLSLPQKPSDVLALNVGEYSIGLGDLLVYSSLPASAFVNLSPLAGLMATAMIPLGVGLSILRAKKRGIIPALPIPVGLMSLCFLPFVLRNSFLEPHSVHR